MDAKSANNENYRWVTQPLDRYTGKTVHVEFSPLENSPFSIVQVVDGPAPQNVQIANDRPIAMEPSLKETIDALDHRETELEPMRARNAASMIQAVANHFEDLLESDRELCSKWSKLLECCQPDQSGWVDAIKWDSRLAMVMVDGTGQNDSVLIRGNHDHPGHEVARRPLEALGGREHVYSGKGSGRLELAQHMTAPEHPIASRVMANRVWHHLMGRGIVATTDDFGVQGQLPTHPQLLDHLANYLVEHDWSTKALIKYICLSKTYQMSSDASAESLQLDPTNKWLSHARVRRLEAEAIRDSMLAISGRIDLQLEGDTPRVHLTEFLQGRGRPASSGPLDGNGRRSVYLEVRRNFLNPMMTTFDTPVPFSCMGRRNVSNVPGQSLTLLNDPLMHLLAESWTLRAVTEFKTDEERIRGMYECALSREPTDMEMRLSLEWVQTGDTAHTLEVWTSFAHMLMNVKEAIFRL
jgi:hypothetical protein